MIYFDNAATGGFKPENVIRAVTHCLRELCVNAGRSSHTKAIEALNIIMSTRETVASFFGSSNSEGVIFTKNCTEALNMAILGTVKDGGEVIITSNEHNSTIRPCFELERRGRITLKIATPTTAGGAVTASDIEPLITDRTYLICVNHVSNVTGATADIESIGKLCAQKGIMLLVDAAQSGGHIDIDMQRDNISMLAAAGHKGLLAPPGIGLLVINDANVNPITFGGTGTDSHSVYQPDTYPEAMESGTLNLPAIAGLKQGLIFIKEKKARLSLALEQNYTALYRELKSMSEITMFSKKNQCGIISFLIDGIDSDSVGDILSSKFNIAIRSGLHCAPLIHDQMGTLHTGLVRVSLSAFNTMSEVSTFLDAIHTMI